MDAKCSAKDHAVLPGVISRVFEDDEYLVTFKDETAERLARKFIFGATQIPPELELEPQPEAKAEPPAEDERTIDAGTAVVAERVAVN